MDKKLIDSYLENIAELVVDEDKIVTYKSLSRSLGIHVNTAKQLLYTYLTQQKIKNAFPASATYLLAGKLADGSFNITIVNESELESTYSKFIEITSEHIYSVQKGKTVREISMLCGVDKGTQERESLVITSSKCVRRSKAEEKKKPGSNKQDNTEVIKKAFGIEKEMVFEQESNKKVENSEKKEIVKSPKKASPKKQKEKSQATVKKPAGNIANMFAKAAQKNAEKPKSVKNQEKEPGFLISKEEVEVVECEKDKSGAKVGGGNSEGAKNRHEIKETGKGDTSSDEELVIKRKKKKSTPKSSPKKKKGSKRKRICMGSDSNDSDSSDELPQIPVEEEDLDSVSATAILEDDGPTEPQSFNKRKKRKIVDKTVMHEDGYLETRKEVVLETDSEDAEEEPKKDKNSKPIAKSKPATSNAPKKQSSLLTFFKKS